MRKNVVFYVLIFSSMFCAGLLTAQTGIHELNVEDQHTAAAEGILFVTEEWAPYNFEENGIIKGLSVDIIREIMIDLGVSYPVEMLPGIRARRLTEERKLTAMFTVFRTPEREHMFQWVGPIDDGTIYFYRRSASSFRIETLSDASQVTAVSCRSEGLVPNLLRQEGFTNLEYAGMESIPVLKKLIFGQTQLAVCDTDTGVRYYLKKMEVPEHVVVKTTVSVYSACLYIAFNKDFPPEIVSAWQKSFDKLKETGSVDKIRSRYR